MITKSIPVTVSFPGAGTNIYKLVEMKELVEVERNGRKVTTQQTMLDGEGKPVMTRKLFHVKSRVTITRNFSPKDLFSKLKAVENLHGVDYPKNATADQILKINLEEYHFHDVPEVRVGKDVTFTIENPI